MSSYYNFLPPFDQLYPSTTVNGFSAPSSIGDITRLDPYLPAYNITSGTLTPLGLTGPSLQQPANIYGIQGPTGPGLSGNPPPATSFMMTAYGQTSQGIIQFVLMKGSTTVLKNPNITPGSQIKDYYFFAPINNTIDFSRVVQLYYTIDNSQNSKNSAYFNQYGSTGVNPTGIRFFNAELVRQNPSSSVYDYELVGQTYYKYEDPNSYVIWPSKPGVDSNQPDFSPTFYFNELVNKTNTNETQLNIGTFYHPLLIDIDGSSSIPDEYKNYQNGSYYNGYGPGYPININYINATINFNTTPVISNGFDLITTQYQGNTQNWPAPVPLSVYNLPVSNVLDYVSGYNGSLSNDEQYIINAINNVCENNPFLPCSCSSNNNCGGQAIPTYYQQNVNSIQTGIANYLIYQFIPFEHIKAPNSFIITDPYNPGNTGYTYVTLPYGPSGPAEVTPTGYGPLGGFGSYPIQSNVLIDTSLGNTGTTESENSIIQGWINNPQNLGYQCSREVTSTDVCGFLDYYDSLFGITYSSGTCGAVGNGDPFQKGGCTGTQICVPNYEFLKNYNSQIQQPFICVEGATGVSYDNLSNYYQALPAINPNNTPLLARYNQDPFIAQGNATKTTPTTDYWLWIAILIGIILLIVVIVFVIKSFKSKVPNYSASLSKVSFT